MTARSDAEATARQCGVKRQYLSRAVAKRVARHTARAPGGPRHPTKIYRCPICGWWHVAHRSPEDHRR